MKRDVDYVVKDGQVIIVDEFTGRLMIGRRYSDGLHQAIEAKEGVKVERENRTLATITFQNYFRMYKKLSGMTGTAKTEEEEFQGIYKLDVVHDPHQQADDPQGPERRRVRQPEGASSTPWSTRSSSATRPGSRCWWAPCPWKRARCVSKLLETRGVPPRGAERQDPRKGSGDRGPGRQEGRRDHRHQHGRPRHRHSARRQRRSSWPASEMRQAGLR